MPSKKSFRAAERKSLRNRAVRSAVRTAHRKAQRLTASGSVEEASTAVLGAISHLDRVARKRIIHPNKAARHKSQLTRQLNAARARES